MSGEAKLMYEILVVDLGSLWSNCGNYHRCWNPNLSVKYLPLLVPSEVSLDQESSSTVSGNSLIFMTMEHISFSPLNVTIRSYLP